MNDLDDRPLERNSPPDATVSEGKRAGMPSLAIIALAGLVVGAVAAWWWIQARRTPVPVPTSASPGTEAVALPADPARSLPPLDQMDTFLRALIGALSSHPDLLRWLATDDLIRQLANGIDRVSRGQTLARELPMLRPKGDFTVERRGREISIDPASFRRYDHVAALVDSLDARAVVDTYRTIHPRLAEAYRSLGRSESAVDDAVGTALQLVLDTPVESDLVKVVPGRGATYAYANPQYEALAPIQKQVLRMGPTNARRIQTRLREIQKEFSATRQ
jgi:hypothetical protein